MSFFLDPQAGGETFIFANEAWTRNEEWMTTCSSGGTMHTAQTISLPLPQPREDPISLLAGHGYVEDGPGTKCVSQAFDEKFTRTGD